MTTKTKQDEIREGIKYIISVYERFSGGDTLEGKAEKMVRKIFEYLSDNDVVIKVDRELPEHLMAGQEAYPKEDIKRRFEDAGYVAVESLIEDS